MGHITPPWSAARAIKTASGQKLQSDHRSCPETVVLKELFKGANRGQEVLKRLEKPALVEAPAQRRPGDASELQEEVE